MCASVAQRSAHSPSPMTLNHHNPLLNGTSGNHRLIITRRRVHTNHHYAFRNRLYHKKIDLLPPFGGVSAQRPAVK